MDLNHDNPRTLLSFVFVATAPVVMMIIFITVITLIPRSTFKPYLLALSFLLIHVSAFVANRIKPIATDEFKATIIALPSALVLLFFIPINAYFISRELDDLWYLIRLSCFIGPTIAFLSLIITAFCSRLGAIVNKKLFSKQVD